MKRNVISLLLALVLVFAVTVALAPAAEATVPTHDHTTGWTAMDAGKTAADGDMLYLTKVVAGAITIPAGTEENPVEVTLCLNGYVLRAQKPIVFQGEYAHLTICDCATRTHNYSSYVPEDAETSGLVQFTATLSDHLNMVTLSANQTLTLQGGTLNGTSSGQAKGKSYAGRTVQMSGGTLNVTGGNIVGANLTGSQYTNWSNNHHGLAVRLDSGIVNMSGGTIYGGTPAADTTKASQATSVYMTGGEFNLSGTGCITGGTSTAGKHGGNVFMSGGSFNMSGNASITDGHNTGKGANVMIQTATGKTATFSMAGGTISGGQAANGGNVCLNSISADTYAIFTMTGGEIKEGVASANGDGVYVYNNTNQDGGNKLVVGGTAKICDNEGENVYLHGPKAALEISTETPLAATANIKVTLGKDVTSFASGATANDAQYFSGDNGYIAVREDGALKLVEPVPPHIGCWCNDVYKAQNPSHVCYTDAWTAHTDLYVGSPTFKLTYTDTNRYVYIDGTEMIGSINFGGLTGEFYLDLNGATFRGSTPISVPENVTLYICDGTDKGRVACTNSTNSNAVAITGGTVNMMSGTLEGQARLGSTTYSNRNVSISSGGTFNLYGGSIQNGWIDIGSGNGGNIYIPEGTFHMFDGTVKDGVADSSADNTDGDNRGGNIYATNKGTIIIEGGSITGGNAKGEGGNIYAAKGATISNAQISGGTGYRGGNLWTNGTVEMTNTTVSNGAICENVKGETDAQKVANWYIASGTATVSNCTFTLNNNTVTNVRRAGAQELVVDGGSITGGNYALYVGNGTGTLKNNPTITAAIAQLMVGANASGKIVVGENVTNDYTLDISGDLVEGRLMVEDADNTVGTFTCPEDAVSTLTWKAAEGDAPAGWHIGELIIGAKVGDLTFKTLAKAVEYGVAEGRTVTLQMNVVEDIDVDGILTLNLNGHTITGDVSATELNCFDSTTNLYDDTKAGHIDGAVEGAADVYVHDDGSAIRKYMKIVDGNQTSFHRFYVAISKMTLNPNGYVDMVLKTTFLGDQAVADYINNDDNVSYGIHASIEKDAYVENTNPFVAGPYDQTTLAHNVQVVGLRDAFKDGNPDQKAQMEVTAKAYIKIGDTYYESAERVMSLNDAIESANNATLTVAQKNALVAMVNKYYYAADGETVQMTSWTKDIIGNICPELFPETEA